MTEYIFLRVRLTPEPAAQFQPDNYLVQVRFNYSASACLRQSPWLTNTNIILGDNTKWLLMTGTPVSRPDTSYTVHTKLSQYLKF